MLRSTEEPTSPPFPPHLWPRCARCGKPVEEVAWWQDMVRGGLVVEARCHGASERAALPDWALLEVAPDLSNVSVVEVFRGPPALPPGPG